MDTHTDSGADAWRGFAPVLALTLARLPAWSIFVMEAAGHRYAQFVMTDSELTCQIVSNKFLAAPYRMRMEDELWLGVNGWAQAPGGGNWQRTVAWPARMNVYEEVAERIVTVLRDVLRIGEPQDMVTRGEIQETGEPPDTSALGLRAASKERAE